MHDPKITQIPIFWQHPKPLATSHFQNPAPNPQITQQSPPSSYSANHRQLHPYLPNSPPAFTPVITPQ